MSSIIDLNPAYRSALARWQNPSPAFASGYDPRTSDNALLVITYGGLVHAANHDWQNAGRRLIDRTYIDILWQVEGLSRMRACRPEQTAAALDGFIRDRVEPTWTELQTMGETGKSALAAEWVDHFAHHGFGSLSSKAAASRLLFYLCPMLPVFNLSRGHLLALERLGYAAKGDHYPAYARAADSAYRGLLPALRSMPRPAPVYGEPAERALIRQVLETSDWWHRRVFDEWLRKGLPGHPGDSELWGCDDAGRLTAVGGARR
jgi:hypothetical protein